MDLTNSPLSVEVAQITAGGANPISYEYTATVHTTADDLTPLKVVSVDILRDYVNNVGDAISIELLFPLGDYVKQLFPFRTNLELTLTRKLLHEVGNTKSENVPIDEERFKAVFLTNENVAINGGQYDMVDQAALNLMDFATVHLQLLNRSLEPLRIKTTGGVFKSVTPENLIHAVMAGEANRILIDGQPAIEAIDIVTPNNTTPCRTIVIPHQTNVMNIPTFLQEKMNGVYSGGIGTYLQSFNGLSTIFVYPLFNTKRFDSPAAKMIMFGVPSTKHGGTERTYRKEGNVVYILGTGSKLYVDDAETDQMSDGVGFRMTDANAMMGKPVMMTAKGPVGARNRLNTEVALKNRSDGLNYAGSGSKPISSNPYAEYSRVMQREGGRYDFVWENASYKEIYPGMPCKIIYLEKSDTIELNGIVLCNHVLIQMAGKGLHSKSHTTTCKITVFVERKPHP